MLFLSHRGLPPYRVVSSLWPRQMQRKGTLRAPSRAKALRPGSASECKMRTMTPQTQPLSSSVEQFRFRIQARTAKVGIIGLGYVGLPLALLFNEQGFPVTGFDIDAGEVRTLNSKGPYIDRVLK